MAIPDSTRQGRRGGDFLPPSCTAGNVEFSNLSPSPTPGTTHCKQKALKTPIPIIPKQSHDLAPSPGEGLAEARMLRAEQRRYNPEVGVKEVILAAFIVGGFGEQGGLMWWTGRRIWCRLPVSGYTCTSE